MKMRGVILVLILSFVANGCAKSPQTAKSNAVSAPVASAAPQPSPAPKNHKLIHVFVALCDNDSQGIVPVPARIGNGDDAASNLYWGSAEGLKTHFSRSADWRLLSSTPNPTANILERCLFQHRTANAYLLADAYRGSNIQDATEDFFAAAAGRKQETVTTRVGQQQITLVAAGSADLVAYIGHNGLMDFSIAFPEAAADAASRDAIVLCCISERYFRSALDRCRAKPILMTTQLMYPGAFILRAALDGWLRGESPTRLRERAANVYAANQHISVGAARGIFAPALDR